MNYFFQVIFLLLSLLSSSHAVTRFLVISDIHYGSENNSEDGQDTGTKFLEATMNKVKQLSGQVSFILNLGDLPTHISLNTAKKAEYEAIVFHSLYEADAASKPMFYIPGNNDSLGGNYQPFDFNGRSPLNLAVEWSEGACAHCKDLLLDKEHMHSHGYYSSYVIPDNKDVLLIALNTTIWTKPPLLLPAYPNQASDAQAQMNWFEEQLKYNSAKQLLIAIHVPPGNSYKGPAFWYPEYSKKFVGLLNKYHHSFGQITVLAGHTHMDELRKISLADGTNVYVYFTPAISRIHRNNPGLKVYTLDEAWALKNYITYYTTDINSWSTQYYQAIGAQNNIFPKCQGKNLPACLDGMSEQEVCSTLEGGAFYGVKSRRVPQNVCTTTYPVNKSL